jgi:alkylation response protein AidB-like acyl-CoA dehydrogenase
MEFGLDPDQQRLQDAAIEFARKELNSDILERDRIGAFCRAAWKKCAAFGVHGLPIPVQYGGSGVGEVATVAVMEGLGYGCRDNGLLFSINAHMWTSSVPLLRYGTEEQKQKYLPGLCSGALIGANGVSEPGSGSDVFSMRTRATRSGDYYLLNGSKTFVTNAPVADVFMVYASLDPGLGALGICGFIVEKGTPGLSIGGKIAKMGLRTSPMAEVVFDNCRVPARNLVGRKRRGVEVFNCSMAYERACILATCVGNMKRQLEMCIEYAKKREQFGKPISKFQSVANRIVDMELRYETARLLTYKIGWLIQKGDATEMDAAMAKLYVSESYVKSCLDAVQIHGGYGYTTEFEVERELRDSIGSTLYSGTSEIQRNIIASALQL